MKLIYKCTCIIACLAIMSCHKDKNTGDSAIKQLTSTDSGSTATVSMGQTISLTLGNPGDGGYQFNDPKYNSSVLTLVSHKENVGVHAGMIGDFGKDIWTFTAKGSGTTTLEVTAHRGNTEIISMFSNQIVVK
ncbi:protease inhibitor I42 family protein [Mucilaginibacter ginsenosidivorax]|uniref:Protease inhibitor I42 family protein n=1 Tax=Mucilaginibacter ginsenosidivorax TaxID=862126 RepID=A0A5B8VXB0_9SPHI|nr:protease inhibitor I42 family protein [Mucilaginibacter ginsenosidivorax]QEC75046.1 protease inhibitor I42 family protein [Mucilaginibacter ginsenosidivorax]